MNRVAIREEKVGTFCGNNIQRYSIHPPCSCGETHVCVDDYWTSTVNCDTCKQKLFDEFKPIFASNSLLERDAADNRG